MDDDFEIVFEPEDETEIVFVPPEPDLGAEVACTRCGTADNFTFACFRDRHKIATAALACRACGIIWPIQMSSAFAAEVRELRAKTGIEIEEAAQ